MPSTTSSPLPQMQQISLACAGHTRPVVQLNFSNVISNNNYFLISACKDGKPILRYGPTGDWLGTFVGHKGAVWSAMLNADTTRAVTASADYTVKVWDAITGKDLITLSHGNIVKSADFVGDTDLVITGSQDKAVRVFDINRPDAPTTIVSHTAPVRSVKWSKHLRLAVCADNNNSINLVDPRTSSVVKSLEAPGIANISLTNDGRLLSCAAGKRILAWDLDTFTTVKDFTVDYDVSVTAINPERTRIVTGGRSDLLIRSYDFATENQIDTHKGHHGSVHDACFSPDGHIYATGSEDGTVRLWQTNPGSEYGLWQSRKP